jgi:hypothetical protein
MYTRSSFAKVRRNEQAGMMRDDYCEYLNFAKAGA